MLVQEFFVRRQSRYSVSSDRELLQPEVLLGFLRQSYWAQGLQSHALDRMIAGSHCFGLFDGEAQIGFCRVISDQVTVAYLLATRDAHQFYAGFGFEPASSRMMERVNPEFRESAAVL
jgi:hypothetical protein